jgi:nucleolar GTP-binding protein
MQFSIYKEIREKFPGHLWLDVVSKADLLKSSPVIYATEDRDLTQHELEKYLTSGPDGAINVSVTTQKGILEVRKISITFS